MRAVVYTETGPSSVLRLVERDAARARARARSGCGSSRAGVNPTDWKFRAGMMTAATTRSRPARTAPASSTPSATGVDGLAVGDRVWLVLAQHGRAYGTAAEWTVQPADRVVPLPDGGVVRPRREPRRARGHRPPRAHLRRRRPGWRPGALDGRTVLVAGGAGAVGNAAIQLARWAGATVVTTVSSPDEGRARRARPARTTSWTTAPTDATAAILAIAPDGVDLVVEVAPAPNQALDLAVTRVHGTIAIYANNGGDRADAAPAGDLLPTNLRYQFIILYTLDAGLRAHAVADVSAALADGALRVGEDAGLPLHHFPLEETAAAHDAVEAGAVGKVLLDLG